MWIASAVNILNRLKYQTLSGALLLGVCFNGTVFGADKNGTDLLHTYSVSSVLSILHEIPAPAFKQNIQVRVFLPPNYSNVSNLRYPSLYINDGQDADAVELAETLNKLYAEQKIDPVIVIAISMLPDRMATYGFSDREAKLSLPAQTRNGLVGVRAQEYSEWLAMRLVTFIDSNYQTLSKPEARTILGWSLGAANAFNIAWNYPDVFSKVGAFSPSFWLSAKSDDFSQSLARKLIASKPMPRHFSIWLAVGTNEETDDRDADGVIDALDDAQAVIDALNAKTPSVKQNEACRKFQLRTYKDGQHSQSSWKVMLPDFLQWAYPVVPP